MHYTVDPMLLPSGNPIRCHEEVLFLQPMIPLKRFDISPPAWGMLRRSRCVQIYLLTSGGYSEDLDGFRFFYHCLVWNA